MLEVFAIKFTLEDYKAEIFQECTETFSDEIQFKNRLTQLQDDYRITDIKVYGGSIPQRLM